MVKRLRRRPLTAESGVRFPMRVPKPSVIRRLFSCSAKKPHKVRMKLKLKSTSRLAGNVVPPPSLRAFLPHCVAARACLTRRREVPPLICRTAAPFTPPKMLSARAPNITPQNMRFAGTPDITPQNIRFAGTPEYLRGIVKAPDKVMAETHKKTHFADARRMRLRAETHKKTHFADARGMRLGAEMFLS